MALQYSDLDPDLRVVMVAEFDNYPRYVSAQVVPERNVEWETGLRLALESETDEWLEARILAEGYLADFSRPDKNGRVSRINKESGAKMLAEGQFNSYYVRAVCVRAIERGDSQVLLYRGRASQNPRPRSVEIEGSTVDAAALLAALRTHDFEAVEAAFGMPLPNSGLTVRIAQ